MKLLPRKMPTSLIISALLVALSAALGHAQSTASPAAPVLVAKIAANLSSKNAKVGDTFVAKTVKAVKLTDGTDIPKGSKLIGKVSAVQSKKDGNGNAMLTFRIDQIEPKGGAAIPVKGFVVAIGPSLAPKDGLGGNSVLSRNVNTQGGTGVTAASQGTGSSNGLNPNAGLGGVAPKDEDDIAMGSTLPGVALGRHLDADWTTALQGVHTEIDLNSDVVIKVQLK
jgi:hypothetical protein